MQALPRPPPLTIPFDGTVSPRVGVHTRACMPTELQGRRRAEDWGSFQSCCLLPC